MSLSTLFYVYLIVASVGLSFSLLSLLFGGGLEDNAELTGHLDSSDVDTDHNGITVSDVFTLRNFLLFMVGFGATGMLAVNAGCKGWSSSGFGFLGGVTVAFLGFLFYRAIGRQQGNSATKLGALVGKDAVVITAIPSGGYGEIRTSDEFGTAVTLPAQSEDGAIAGGFHVQILKIAANAAVVKKLAA